MVAARHSQPPAPCHPGSQGHSCLLMLKTLALRDPGNSCSQISMQNFHKQIGSISDCQSFPECPINLLYSSSHLWKSGTSAGFDTCYVEDLLYLSMSWLPLPSSNSNFQESFCLKNSQKEVVPLCSPLSPACVGSLRGQGKRPQPISASCIWFPVHLWSDVLNQLPVHCLPDLPLCSSLLYWILFCLFPASLGWPAN